MKTFLVLLSLLFSSITIASESDSRSFNYYGSNNHETLNLNTESYRTEYRYVQVPYTERICRNETRYRQECRQEPGRQVCRQQPGRQVCRQQPPRQVCRTRNGRQICRQVPGRRVCRQVPGRRVCRQEPGRRVCRQVPYNERICRNETRYRQERRAYTVIDTRTAANLTFTFDEALEALAVSVDVRADLNRDHLTVTATDRSTPARLIRDDVSRSRFGSRDNLSITENHRITLTNSEELFSPIREELTNARIENGIFSVRAGKIHHAGDLIMSLTVRANGQIVMTRTLTAAEYNLVQRDYATRVKVNLSQIGLNLPAGTSVAVDFNLSVDSSRYLNAGQFGQWNRAQTFNLIIN